jgi:iron complex transport system ATP-binding protein
MSGISATGVAVARDGQVILTGVELTVAPGEVVALVGPNGAGKSTLLAAISGDIPITAGAIELAGRPLESYRHIELARERAVLTQDNQLSFPFTVGQVVSMGRTPWSRTEQFNEDEVAIAEAMVAMDVDQLATRRYTSLSGGEKARVSLARVLAQRTGIVMLDEPTAALDLRHQEDVMRAVRGLAEKGTAVLVVVHDLSLAAAYADRVAVVARHTVVAAGPPEQVLTAELVSRVYGLPVDVSLASGRPVVVPIRERKLEE